jgi:Zn-dependent protease
VLDLTLPVVLARGVVLLPLAALYGASLCHAARLLGDAGPTQDGRGTLNPFAHIDLVGALAFVAFGIGWIKPLSITPTALKGGLIGIVGVVLSGTLVLVLLATVAAMLLPQAGRLESLSAAQMLGFVLITLCRDSIGFALFNLLPVPPLSAGLLIDGVAPRAAAWIGRRALLASVIMLVIVATGLPNRLIDPGIRVMIGLVSQDASAVLRTM